MNDRGAEGELGRIGGERLRWKLRYGGRLFCDTDMLWVRHWATSRIWEVNSFNQQTSGQSLLRVYAEKDHLAWVLLDARLDPRTVATLTWEASSTVKFIARSDGTGSDPRVSQSVDDDDIVVWCIF